MMLCNAATDYCEITYSDVPTPDSVLCRPIPAACAGRARCACVTDSGGGCFCTDQPDGTLVRHCPGG
jgi:hypothetical protein